MFVITGCRTRGELGAKVYFYTTKYNDSGVGMVTVMSDAKKRGSKLLFPGKCFEKFAILNHSTQGLYITFIAYQWRMGGGGLGGLKPS